MKPFTVFAYDDDEDAFYTFHVMAESSDSNKLTGQVKQFLFEKAVSAGDTDFDDIETINDVEDAITGLNILAVFNGHHDNMISPDIEVEHVILTEGWEITIPSKTDPEPQNQNNF